MINAKPVTCIVWTDTNNFGDSELKFLPNRTIYKKSLQPYYIYF